MLGYTFSTQTDAHKAFIDCASFYNCDNLLFPEILPIEGRGYYVEFRAFLWAVLGSPMEISNK